MIAVRKGQQRQLTLAKACSQGTCARLQYRFAEMKGMHKMRLSPISAYRKKATAVHWRVMVEQVSWGESQFQWKLINIQNSFWMFMLVIGLTCSRRGNIDKLEICWSHYCVLNPAGEIRRVAVLPNTSMKTRRMGKSGQDHKRASTHNSCCVHWRVYSPK